MTTTVPLSILDLASVGKGETIAESFEGSVALARLAEQGGFRRVWYAEHHSIASIASSATAVLIAHVAAHTDTIRLGSGGIMLPNHSPLVIAEQFGTLATLHPDRIDLGLGRAPGSDQATSRALRRDPAAADTFPQDVMELRGLLSDESPIPGVHAIPGEGTHVPLYILGSSLYGAQVAALLGLPYAFASHFAPQALHAAVRIYRERFSPSPELDQPYVMAGVNVIAADSEEVARDTLQVSRRMRIRRFFATPDVPLSDDECDVILASPRAASVDEMLTYTAVGEPDAVVAYLDGFARDVGADELVTVHHATTIAERLHSVELLAGALNDTAASRQLIVHVDLLFDPFDGDWAGVRAGAIAAEAAGFDGIWLWDHLAGSTHGARGVLECWTTLTAIAAVVPRVAVGPMVLNVANRDAGMLAVMAATLQDVSDGRLLLGIGAGGGRDTPYVAEQRALGRGVPGDARRRGAVEDAVARVRDVWTGSTGGAGGFLRPDPPPPIVIGGFAPRMAEVAGRIGDGINTPASARLPELLRVAREAHERAGRDPEAFLVTVSADPSPATRERLAGLGVDRVVTYVAPPYADGVERARRTRDG